MIFTSALGILLSLIFGCLLLVLIAELYYLLWWKKQSKSHNTSSSDSSTCSSSRRNEVEDYIKHAKQQLYLFCWNKPSTQHQTCTAHHESTKTEDPDLESGKDFLFKPSFGGVGEEEEEGVESELMRLHNLSGPPRFLFTIKEETKEDLESEDGRYSRSRKGSRTRSLSDLIIAAESPLILSPLASPPMKAAAGSYNNSGGFVECRYSHHGFNPLFESSNVLEAELNRLRCSPPPKLKFLRDAEEKLYRRLLEEAERMEDTIKKVDHSCGGGGAEEEEVECRDGSFIRIIVGKNREREVQHHKHNRNNQHHVLVHSTSSQVLPLASSPPTSSAFPI